MKTKILKQDKKVKDNMVVVTRQTQEELSREDLLRMKQQVINNQSRVQEQMKRIQDEYVSLKEKEKEINDMLAMIPETELE